MTAFSALPGIAPPVAQPRSSEKPTSLYLLGCGFLAAIAFSFNWSTGHRGIFLFDQSVMFDGGWRVLQGQTPYKEMLSPFGPVAFYIQAFCFRFFGVNWSATVIPACVLNVLATLSAIRVVRLLTDGSRALGLCAGLSTALCFQAPFGTLWFEQTALFFDLVALQAAVEALQTTGMRRNVWRLAGGVSLGVAIFSKQNFGVFFIPVFFAVLATGELPDFGRTFRALLAGAAGTALAVAGFFGWLLALSDFGRFVEYGVRVAGAIGRSRLTPGSIGEALGFNRAPNLYQFDVIALIAGALALGLAFCNFRRPAWNELAPMGAVAFLLPVFRSFTQTTTDNEWQNNFAFVGLAGCVGVALAVKLGRLLPIHRADLPLRLPSATTLRVCFYSGAAFWGALAIGYTAKSAWGRYVQEFKKGTTFQETVHVRGLERVRWGEPTRSSPKTVLRKSDLEDVAAYLAARKAQFFVMGDSSLLYGLLGVRSPQPLLYFLPSHSFLERQTPKLDELIVSSLERNRVDVIVREKRMWVAEAHPDCYGMFRRTSAWMASNFVHGVDFGAYEIWERRPETPR